MREKKVGDRERDNCCQKIIFVFSGFTFAIGAHSISEEVEGFLLYGFPEENSVSFVSCVYCCACYSLR